MLHDHEYEEVRRLAYGVILAEGLRRVAWPSPRGGCKRRSATTQPRAAIGTGSMAASSPLEAGVMDEKGEWIEGKNGAVDWKPIEKGLPPRPVP
jgi:hypothetical protein